MTERDGSRTLRAPTVHVPREKRAANGGKFTFVLPNGHYRLRERFVGSKIDRRTTGPGMSTPEGLPKGTRFRVQDATWMLPEVHARVISAPWLLGTTDLAIARGDEWRTSIPDDMLRLFELLEPDDSLQTWLDTVVDSSKHMHGHADEVLLHLLETGVVTKDQILAAKAAVDAKEVRT